MTFRQSRRSTWCSLRALGPVRRCAIIVRGGGYCAWCRAPLTQATAEIDHVVRRCDGGKDANDNLVGACSDCNQQRPCVPGDLAQLTEPLDYGAGLQLALAWYPFMPARIVDRNRRWRASASRKKQANLNAAAEGLAGSAFPFGVAT